MLFPLRRMARAACQNSISRRHPPERNRKFAALTNCIAIGSGDHVTETFDAARLHQIDVQPRSRRRSSVLHIRRSAARQCDHEIEFRAADLVIVAKLRCDSPISAPNSPRSPAPAPSPLQHARVLSDDMARTSQDRIGQERGESRQFASVTSRNALTPSITLDSNTTARSHSSRRSL